MVILFATALSNAVLADGNIDPTFNASVTEGDGQVFETVAQPDGKIIAVGQFQRANGMRAYGIARFNTDGSIDPSFQTGSGANLGIRAVALQSDGKVIIAGNFTTFNGVAVNRIVRLNSDGSVDDTFSLGVVFNGQINDLLVLPSGKIIVAGNFVVSSARIVRLNSDGTLDTGINGFNNQIYSVALAPEGKIVVGGLFSLPQPSVARLNSDGSVDATFDPTTGANSLVYFVKVQPDGKVLAGGYFSSFNGTATDQLVRLNDNGTVESTFSFPPASQPVLLVVTSIALQADGKILAARLDDGAGIYGGIHRFNSDTTLDTTFDPTGLTSFLFSI